MSDTGIDVVLNTPSKITVGCRFCFWFVGDTPTPQPHLTTAPYNPDGHPDRHARAYECAVVGVEIGGFAALASRRTLDFFLSAAAD